MGKSQDWNEIGPFEAEIDAATGASLEAGIAAVFEAIRSGDGVDDTGEEAEVEDNGATFALLSELNRLWERPQA